MGANFSTIQIRNPYQIEQFKNLLCDYFRKKGLESTTEEDAEVSYWLAFTEGSSWATLGSGGYDPSEYYTVMPEIAKELNTYCIISSVWESDTLELRLFDANKLQCGEITVMAGIPCAGKKLTGETRKIWEPILAEGKTWEQVLEVCKGNYTFAEGALCDIAPLFGISSKNVTNIYDCSHNISSSIPNVTDLHFKEAQPSSGNIVDLKQYRDNAQDQTVKKRSFNTVFKEVFGEGLAPLDFVKIKGRQPYFVRLVGGEILHIVTYMPREGKHFEIWGGVATIYRSQLPFDEPPKHHTLWLKSIFTFYAESISYEYDYEETCRYPLRDLQGFYYEEETRYNERGQIVQNPNRHGTIIDVVKYALEQTKEIIVPVFDKATDIDSCMEYLIKRGQFIDVLSANTNETFDKGLYNEELLLLAKSRNRDLYITNRELVRETQLARITRSIETGRTKLDQSYIDFHKKECQRFVKERPQRIAQCNEWFDRFFSNGAWHEKALLEMERRKATNTEILRSYGLKL